MGSAFRLDDDQRAILDAADRYARERLAPLARRMDDEEWWPDVEFRALGRDGYLGIWTGGPISYGGTAAPATDKPVLRYGTNSTAVRILQAGLNKVFPSYPSLPLVVDGDFGPRTELAVKEFQRRVGLPADGVVGPATREQLAKYGIRP